MTGQRQGAASPPGNPGAWRAAALAGLLLLPVWAHEPALGAPTLVSDDLHFVTQDRRVREPALRAAIWTHPLGAYDPEGRPGINRFGGVYYRPLALHTFAWTFDLAGPTPGAYRFGNLLLHLAAALVMWTWLRGRGSELEALGPALLLATHPLVAEVTAFFSGRFDLMASLLVLAAGWVAASRDRRLPLAAALYLAACLCKETAVLLAPILPLAAARGPTALARTRARRAAAAAALVVTAVLVLRLVILGQLGDGRTESWLASPGVTLGSAWVCLRHLLAPGDLQLFGYTPEVVSAPFGGQDVAALAGLAVLGTAVTATWRAGSRRPVSVALLTMVLPLLPLLNPQRLAFPFSDRYLYPSLCGLALLAGLATTRPRSKGLRTGLAVLCLGVAVVNAGRLRSRCAAFRSADALLETVLAQEFVHPYFLEVARQARARRSADELPTLASYQSVEDPTLLLAAAQARLAAGLPGEARGLAARVPPEGAQGAEAGLLIARTLIAEAHLESAHERLTGLAARLPGDPRPWILLGELELSRGRAAAALAPLEEAVKLRRDAAGLFHLGRARLATDAPEIAVVLLLEARDLAPEEPGIHAALAVAARALGREEEAAGHERQAAARARAALTP